MTGNPHEQLLVENFILPDRQMRWLSFLSDEKKRAKQLHRLADGRDFVAERMIAISRRNFSEASVVAELRRLGAPKTAYILSDSSQFDRVEMSLEDAVDLVTGLGLGSIVSCIPGKLCYFQGEDVLHRWLLHSKE